MNITKLFKRAEKKTDIRPMNGHAKKLTHEHLDVAMTEMKNLENEYDNVILLSEQLRRKACLAK